MITGRNETKEKVARALANLSSDPQSRTIVREQGGIPPLMELLRSREPLLQQCAVYAFAHLADDPQTSAMIRTLGGIPLLVQLLNSTDVKVKKCAVMTIALLIVKDPDSRALIRMSNGIECLLPLLMSEDDFIKEKVLGSVSCLSFDTECRQRIISLNGALPLTRLLRDSNPSVSHVAGIALQQLVPHMTPEQLAASGISIDSNHQDDQDYGPTVPNPWYN